MIDEIKASSALSRLAGFTANQTRQKAGFVAAAPPKMLYKRLATQLACMPARPTSSSSTRFSLTNPPAGDEKDNWAGHPFAFFFLLLCYSKLVNKMQISLLREVAANMNPTLSGLGQSSESNMASLTTHITYTCTVDTA